MAEDKPTALVVVLDTNPCSWLATPHFDFPFSQLVQHTLVFVNTHLALHPNNTLAVVAAHADKSLFLYPTARGEDRSEADFLAGEEDTGMCEGLAEVDAALRYNIGVLTDSELIESPTCELGGALSKALAFINRHRREQTKGIKDADLTKVKARILVLSVSPDSGRQYVAVMNSIFAAQKQSISIDVCSLRNQSPLLQQAAHVTKGVYLAVDQPVGLLQYLLSVFLGDDDVRLDLQLPVAPIVDFRAACFCCEERKTLDIGFVCSVCLAIYCKPQPECSICHADMRPKA